MGVSPLLRATELAAVTSKPAKKMHFHYDVCVSLVFFYVLLTLIKLFKIICSVLHNISGLTPVHNLESYLEPAALPLVFYLFPEKKYNQKQISCVLCACQADKTKICFQTAET